LDYLKPLNRLDLSYSVSGAQAGDHSVDIMFTIPSVERLHSVKRFDIF